MKKSKRERVLAETDYKCSYCGSRLTEENATIDHILPKKRGGTDCLENLTPACSKCNTEKGDKTPDEYREYLMNKISDLKIKLYTKDKFYYEK